MTTDDAAQPPGAMDDHAGLRDAKPAAGGLPKKDPPPPEPSSSSWTLYNANYDVLPYFSDRSTYLSYKFLDDYDAIIEPVFRNLRLC
jgi:hypothetical protein